MVFTKNDEAVSPVIGVILMVAITVILAAVIAAFVFGMAGNISKTKLLSISLSRPSTSSVTATYNGGTDSNTLVGIWFNTDNTAGVSSIGATGGTTTPVTIGSTRTFSATRNSHIIAVGYFSDGSQQVLIDTRI